MTSFDTIATSFQNLTSFELYAWLDEGNPTDKEVVAIEKELVIRSKRKQAVEDLLW